VHTPCTHPRPRVPDYWGVSSNAPNKRSDLQAEEGIVVIRNVLDAVEKVFVSDVARGCKLSVGKVLQDFGQGGLKVGAAAVSAGMADKVKSYSMATNALQLALRSPSPARVGIIKGSAPCGSFARSAEPGTPEPSKP